jgi:ferredoxin-NADP reductase/nitrite reductase/ring-hydroxylating ferredoxin subunit
MPLTAADVPGFEAALPVSDLPPTGLTKFETRGSKHPVVIVTKGSEVGGVLYAVCPHKQADMSLGDIEDSYVGRGVCIKCPRHRKKFAPAGLNFNVETGAGWVADPEGCVGSYDPSWALPVFGWRVVGGVLYISEEPVKGSIPPPEAGGGGSEPSAAAEGGKAEKKEKKLLKEKLDKKSGGGEATAGPSTPIPATTGGGAGAAVVSLAGSGSAATLVTAEHWLPAVLQSVVRQSADTSLYTLSVPSLPDALAAGARRADLDALHCWHVSLRLQVGDGKPISREYTPVSHLSQLLGPPHTVALLIKHYAEGALTSLLREHAASARLEVSLPESTLLTPTLLSAGTPLAASSASADAGSPAKGGVGAGAASSPPAEGAAAAAMVGSVAATAPAGSAASAAAAASHEREATDAAVAAVGTDGVPHAGVLLLVAGGTGITPLVQAAKWALSPACVDVSHVALVCSNRTSGDILLQGAMQQLVRDFPGKFAVVHCLTGAGAALPDETTGVATIASNGGQPATASRGEATAGSAAPVAVRYLRGRVDAAALRAAVEMVRPCGAATSPASAAAALPFKRIVVSGPRGFGDSVRAAATAAGFPAAATCTDAAGHAMLVELDA